MTQETFRADGAKITVYLDGPLWDEVPTATLGSFTCKSEAAGIEVLKQAVGHVQAHGRKRILAPMDGDTWHSYRVVTQSDDSAAFLMEPPDNPHILNALKGAGFDAISSYFSARVPIYQTGQVAPPKTDLAIEAWDGNDPEGLFAQVFELSTEAFANNAFYKPISRKDFMAMYMPMVPMLKRELIYFARRPDGSLAGFLFGTPNYAEGPKPRSAILKTYASMSKGAGQQLAYAFHKAAAEAGYDTVIHALIHEDNLSALRSAAEGADIFRRYGLFGLRLDE